MINGLFSKKTSGCSLLTCTLMFFGGCKLANPYIYIYICGFANLDQQKTRRFKLAKVRIFIWIKKSIWL